MLERRDTSEPMHVCTCMYLLLQRLIRLVATATIQERRLFCSVLAQVRLLLESGVHSRAAFIRERRSFESGVYSVIYSMSMESIMQLLKIFGCLTPYRIAIVKCLS